MATYSKANLYLDALKVQAADIALAKFWMDHSQLPTDKEVWNKALADSDYKAGVIIEMAVNDGMSAPLMKEYLDDMVKVEGERKFFRHNQAMGV